MPIRLLIVDDHPILSAGLTRMFLRKTKPYTYDIVGTATTAQAGYKLYKSTSPDVIIIDLSLPDKSGTLLIEDILEYDNNAKIVVCSMYDDPGVINHHYKIGVKSYVAKRAAGNDLVNCVESAYKGLSTWPSYPHIDNKHVNNTHQIDAHNPFNNLSNKQLKIMQLYSSGESTQDIANTVFMTRESVNTNLDRIRDKLSLSNNVEIVRCAINYGLIDWRFNGKHDNNLTHS